MKLFDTRHVEMFIITANMCEAFILKRLSVWFGRRSNRELEGVSIPF